MSHINCVAKHTEWQPTSSEDWKCPKCQSGRGFFAVREVDETAHEECDMLHELDEVECSCGYENDGKSLSSYMISIQDYEECPCCSGSGKVVKEKAEYCRAMQCQVPTT